MQQLIGDIRYAIRQLRLSPVFTASAVLTLALGIGGATAIFSLIHAVMLRSLPVSDPGRLYRIGEGYEVGPTAGPEGNWGLFSMPFYERLKTALPEFEEVTAFQSSAWGVVARRAGKEAFSRFLHKEFVTGNYFLTFGVRPFAGRLLNKSDDHAGAGPVAVLSYDAWRGIYGGDRALVGSSLTIGNHPFTIIGITPPGFFGDTLRSEPPDLWLPMRQEPLLSGSDSMLNSPGSAWVRIVGRLRPGETITGISPRLTGILRQWLLNDASYPAVWMPEIRRTLSDQRIDIISAAGGITEMKGEYQRSLRILFGVCALVLLIACTNIANLLLAREITRRRQTALRIAVGASRKRILRLSLVESMILALLGSAAGLFVADGAVRLIVNLAFHSAEFLSSYTASVRPILLFSLAMACLTTVVFGAAPAWLASHTDPVQALRGAGRATRDEFSLPRQAFLVLQAAFSVLLVVVAGLLTHSLSNLQHQQFGFDTANGVHVQLEAAPAPYNFERLARLANEIEDRVNRLPGVESAGLITYGPLNGLSLTEHVFVEGSSTSTLIGSAWKTESSWARVTPRYLPAVGHTLLRGRNFTNADNTSAELVAVVNQSFVNQYLAGEEPLGKRFGIFKPVYAKTFRIIGVVRDAKYEVANLPARPMFFLPAAQQATFSNEFNWPEHFSHRIGGLALKTKLPPSELEPVLKKAISAVDPDVTIVSIRTMKEHVDRALSQQHAVASLARLFSIVALILAGVGLYGVASYTVSQRTNEIGVRMVLGANRQEIIRLVMHGAFKNVVIGLLLGIPLALAAGKLISAQLYGVSMWDPLALSVAIVALGFCAFVAVIIPAVRAASTEPVEALRVEY